MGEKRSWLILLSASLISESGRKLIKESIDKIGARIQPDDSIVIISGDDSIPYDHLFVKGCMALGFSEDRVTVSGDISDEAELSGRIMRADYIYVPDGNVYSRLFYMKQHNLIPLIRSSVTDNGAVYIGSSAGAVIAGIDIELIDYGEFDENKVKLPKDRFEALNLFDGTVIPHYDEDKYLENFKKSMVMDGKEELLRRYHKLYRIGEEECLTIRVEGKLQ